MRHCQPQPQPGRYGTPIDMWSVGCIFAEMLRMLDESSAGRRRKALFPGKSSWGMTPPRGTLGGSGSGGGSAGSQPGSREAAEPFHQEGQLMTIINIIGTPTPEEVEKAPLSLPSFLDDLSGLCRKLHPRPC